MIKSGYIFLITLLIIWCFCYNYYENLGFCLIFEYDKEEVKNKRFFANVNSTPVMLVWGLLNHGMPLDDFIFLEVLAVR